MLSQIKSSEVRHRITLEEVREILIPLNTPQIAFQSYEYLDGEKSIIDAEQQSFVSGKIRNPLLDYPDLDERKLKNEIKGCYGQ